MPQYAVLIFEGVAVEDLPQEVMEGTWTCRTGSPRRAGACVAGLALQDQSTATVIRGDLLTDGPFMETKESLGGIFVIEARDLDHALALARMTPIVEGGVEVRPLIDFEVL